LWVQLIVANALIGFPALWLFFLIFILLNRLRISLLIKRVSLILIAFALVLLTWYLINTLFDRHVFYSKKSYFIYFDFFICILASSLFFSREDCLLEGE
jgi:4-amino-4-deoxy-L-arabinose transferase-like glycosyltransferase